VPQRIPDFTWILAGIFGFLRKSAIPIPNGENSEESFLTIQKEIVDFEQKRRKEGP
jgi:hypothetical protein